MAVNILSVSGVAHRCCRCKQFRVLTDFAPSSNISKYWMLAAFPALDAFELFVNIQIMNFC